MTTLQKLQAKIADADKSNTKDTPAPSSYQPKPPASNTISMSGKAWCVKTGKAQ